jgi:hypothetical protein
MTYNRSQARHLLTRAELDLFEASLADRLGAATPADLRVLIRRARTFRDKAGDQFRRQRLQSRERTGSKGGKGGEANRRTSQKAQLFAEALQRFERRREQLEAAAARDARKAAAAKQRDTLAKQREQQAAARAARERRVSPKAPAKVSSAQAPRAAARDDRAVPAAQSRKTGAAGLKRIHAHVSSAVRRSQARRDRRG